MTDMNEELKRIEEELLPFGFICNGSSQVNIKEVAETNDFELIC